MHLLLFNLLIICYSLFFTVSYGISCCDEIDITFIIDTDTIINEADDTIEFITSIIWSGSAENSGFSAVIYGDNIPQNQDIQIISLEDTTSISQRHAEEEHIKEELEYIFHKIQMFEIKQQQIKNKKHTKSIGLLEAFKKATHQQTVSKPSAKISKLGLGGNDHNISIHDDDKVYFIFDYDNKLITDSNTPDLCHLFHHLDTNAVEDDDETIHFLLGQEFEETEIDSIKCKGSKPEQIVMNDEDINYNTFYEFGEDLIYNAEIMEEIYDITCPAVIEAPAFGGDINLGNHNQWIDMKTVLKCNLEFYDHDNNPHTPDQLDIDESYILVKDYINDDNTFKINDYLLSDPKTSDHLYRIGCISPVYKIEKIKPNDNGVIYKRQKKEDEFNVIKLHLSLPEAPMEYIMDANVKGDIAVSSGAKPAKSKTPKTTTTTKKTSSNQVQSARIINGDLLQRLDEIMNDEDEYYYDGDTFYKILTDQDGDSYYFDENGDEISIYNDDNDIEYDAYFDRFEDEMAGDYESFFWDALMDQIDGLMRQDQYYYDIWYSTDAFLNELMDHIQLIKQYMHNDDDITVNAAAAIEDDNYADNYYNDDEYIAYDDETALKMQQMGWGALKKAWNSAKKGVSRAAKAAARRAKAAARAAANRARAIARAAARRAAAAARRIKEKAAALARKAKQRAIAAARAAKERLRRAAAAMKRKAMEIARKVKEKAAALARKAKEMARRAAEKAKEAIKRGGKFIVGVAKKVANKIMNALDMKLGIKGNRKLLDINKKGDYKYKKTKSFNKKYGGGKGISITTTGQGTIEIEYGYWFKLQISLQFNFFWRILRGNIHIEFKIHGLWELGAYFYTKIHGELQVLVDNILNFEKTFTFFIGPVPVVVTPYLKLSAKLDVIPVEVYGGIRCSYGERFALGYYYDKKQGRKQPIAERAVTSKGCKKKFGIGNEEEQKMYPDECPVAELGFDVTVNMQIGVKLYMIINIYTRFEMVLPFRITIPEMDGPVCGKSKDADMCAVSKHLSVSFTIALYLNIYRGVTIDIGGLGGMVTNMIKPGRRRRRRLIGPIHVGMEQKEDSVGMMMERRRRLIIGEKLIKKITLIKKRTLGCLALKGVLAPLNKHYRSKCCKAPAPTVDYDALYAGTGTDVGGTGTDKVEPIVGGKGVGGEGVGGEGVGGKGVGSKGVGGKGVGGKGIQPEPQTGGQMPAEPQFKPPAMPDEPVFKPPPQTQGHGGGHGGGNVGGHGGGFKTGKHTVRRTGHGGGGGGVGYPHGTGHGHITKHGGNRPIGHGVHNRVRHGTGHGKFGHNTHGNNKQGHGHNGGHGVHGHNGHPIHPQSHGPVGRHIHHPVHPHNPHVHHPQRHYPHAPVHRKKYDHHDDLDDSLDDSLDDDQHDDDDDDDDLENDFAAMELDDILDDEQFMDKYEYIDENMDDMDDNNDNVDDMDDIEDEENESDEFTS